MNDYLNKINGLHEIHISVDPNQIALLRFYCKDKKIKPILAVAMHSKDIENPNQLMISKFKNGTSNEVIEKAIDIAKDMENYGLKIVRRKVEAMMNTNGAPKGDEKPQNKDGYWEFHLKIAVENSSELKLLDNICIKHNAAISFNAFKNEIYPLVTLRLYNTSYNKALELKALLIEDIKKGGFSCNYGIQQELSVYDDNQLLDKGWIKNIF